MGYKLNMSSDKSSSTVHQIYTPNQSNNKENDNKKKHISNNKENKHNDDNRSDGCNGDKTEENTFKVQTSIIHTKPAPEQSKSTPTKPTINNQSHIIGAARSLSSNAALKDPQHCPHSNLSLENIIKIRIRKRNVCYVVGLPTNIATKKILTNQHWFGQFGHVVTIAINKNTKSVQANSIPAHITYDNDISALNAIKFCNQFRFNDGRKLKATFGTQHYCRWFVGANTKCTNVFCGFRHSWCRPQDVITQKDIDDFKAIPAGAYTSQNIMNQPLGNRPPPLIVPATAPLCNRSRYTENNMDDEKFSMSEINGGDPYAFYLSNGTGNMSDSLHVMVKQVMSRNKELELENDRLIQQIKILTENEEKHKQEIRRWWGKLATSQQKEKNLQLENDKLQNDLNKYINSENDARKKFVSWDANDVIEWIMNIDNERYKKYENDLIKSIKTENIDGQCLECLDKDDLHRLGVREFKDKKDLLKKIKELVTC